MHAIIMKDKGLDRGLVQDFNTSARIGEGHFFGFRKMFWDYLNKLNVPFSDTCCLTAGDPNNNGIFPIRYNDGDLERFDGTAWITLGDIGLAGSIQSNSMSAGFFPANSAQSLSGAGALSLTAYVTKFTSTGAAQALTLAAGTIAGHRKKIVHVVDGGSGVLTAAFLAGGTTITFTTVGEYADLMWTGAHWAVLELGNTATPGTPPVLA